METLTDRHLEWGAASRARVGETQNGDRCNVFTLPGGALLAAVDGLGHGPEAALASELALRTVERHSDRPLTEIVEGCHKSLVRTRGVALSLAHWDGRERSVTWIGVGNVEGLLLRAGGGQVFRAERLVLRGGTVGVRLPALQATKVAVPGTGLLVFVTDGITSGFEGRLDTGARPQSMAERILNGHCRGTDDALVLVACLGG